MVVSIGLDHYRASESLILLGILEPARRARTDDLLITNQLLYQLSYAGQAWGLSDGPQAARQTTGSISRRFRPGPGTRYFSRLRCSSSIGSCPTRTKPARGKSRSSVNDSTAPVTRTNAMLPHTCRTPARPVLKPTLPADQHRGQQQQQDDRRRQVAMQRVHAGGVQVDHLVQRGHHDGRRRRGLAHAGHAGRPNRLVQLFAAGDGCLHGVGVRSRVVERDARRHVRLERRAQGLGVRRRQQVGAQIRRPDRVGLPEGSAPGDRRSGRRPSRS